MFIILDDSSKVYFMCGTTVGENSFVRNNGWWVLWSRLGIAEDATEQKTLVEAFYSDVVVSFFSHFLFLRSFMLVLSTLTHKKLYLLALKTSAKFCTGYSGKFLLACSWWAEHHRHVRTR